MKMPKRALIINIDIYNVQVLLLCGENQEKHLIKLNDLKADFFMENRLGSYWYGEHNGETYFIMYIGTNEYSIIAHESVHMAHCIMDHVGIQISMDNTEVEAYLVGYIVDLAAPHVKKILKEPII